jgi:flagellar FliJ protein
MASFTFQLDPVLQQRKLVEEQRQRELAAVQAEYAELEARLRALDQEVRTSEADLRSNRLTGRLDLSFLAAHRRFTIAMQRRAVALAQQMAAVRKRVDDARAALAEAAKQRKILEKLRERRKAQWSEEADRKELAALDEISARIGYRAVTEAAGQSGEPAAAHGESDGGVTP